MADQITKIVVRRGTDAQRRLANATGITFDLGEPVYVTDTKRMFIGDGATAGGTAVGMRNLGVVNQLFGTDVLGYTFEGYSALVLGAAEIGDIIYDKTTRNIYSLSGRSAVPPLVTDLVKYDSLTLVDPAQFEYDSNIVLHIKEQGVSRTNINSNIADGLTLVKSTATDPISIATGSISNGITVANFQFIRPNSLYCNSTGITTSPSILPVAPSQFIGRTAGSTLSAFNFSTLISEIITDGTFMGENGVAITTDGTTITTALSSDIFNIQANSVRINKPTTIGSTLSTVGGATFGGATTIRGVVSATGAAYCTGLFATGDVIAFYTSDKSLKENFIKIHNPLIKLQTLNGYEFDWKKTAPDHLQGKDVGVIANEVELTIPEAVINRPDGIKAVNYNKIVPLLIESIKELSNKVDKLESKIL